MAVTSEQRVAEIRETLKSLEQYGPFDDATHSYAPTAAANKKNLEKLLSMYESGQLVPSSGDDKVYFQNGQIYHDRPAVSPEQGAILTEVCTSIPWEWPRNLLKIQFIVCSNSKN